VKLKQALAHARGILMDNNVEDAGLEGELLLRHVLGIGRTQLYLDLENELGPAHDELFSQLIERRLQGEPSAYITGHREFFGLGFYVDRNVLIPRPESELLVEKALNLAGNRSVSTIAEIGTGCGAVAISLAKNLPGVKLYATDISAPALEVARYNCRKHGVTEIIHLLEGDMLDPLPEPVDMIIANMPYVREGELSLAGPLSFEPVLALDGGPDGVSKIISLCHQAGNKLNLGGYLLLEIGQRQSCAVTGILHKVFPFAEIEVIPDFAGIERVVSLCLTGR
jgi:release factor glutamine methyltransferase